MTRRTRRKEGLLDRHPERLTISAVESVAWELGLSRPTLYRLIARYRLTRTVEALRGPGRGRRAGTRVLDPAEETLIREILEEKHLKPTRPPFERVLEQITHKTEDHHEALDAYFAKRAAVFAGR